MDLYDDKLLNLRELENQIVDLVDKSNLEETLKIQLTELEMLQSMFSNPGELMIDDPSVLADINNFLNGTISSTTLPPQLDYTINLNSLKLEVCVNLPLEYPTFEPDIYVRCDQFDRTQQREINTKLAAFISNLERGDICVYSVIEWLQDNIELLIDTKIENEKGTSVITTKTTQFSRLWIYSHHIYNKNKRREILELAHEYNLSGFSLPGKPGIVCVEGWDCDCEEWWQKIKSLNWKKIMCKKKEIFESDNDGKENRKFKDFKEVCFECSKVGRGREYHMDFGSFYKYLSEHNCEDVFKEYFGVEGK